MIRPILSKEEPLLRLKSQPVTDFKSIPLLLDDLLDTLEFIKTTHPFKRGVGLAAVQIGTLFQMSVVEIEDKTHVLINPEIIETSLKKIPIREGCLSFFQYRAHVPRYEYVKIKALTPEGLEYSLEGRGDSAMLLQHELDHMAGILYFDHLPHREKDLFLSH